MQLKGQIRFSEDPEGGSEAGEADKTMGTTSQQTLRDRTQRVVEVLIHRGAECAVS